MSVTSVKPRRKRWLPAAGVVLAVALAACGPGDDAPSSGDADAAPADTVRLALHFNSPQASWVGIYLADEEGYYADEGIALDIQYLKGSTLAVQAVGSGSADVGLAAPDAILAGIDQDLPLVAVANHIQQDSTGVIVDGDASSFTDLAGLHVTTAQGTAEAGLFEAALASNGLTGEVQVDSVESAAKCTMMLAGQSDACTGFSYSQLVQVELEGRDVSFLPFSTDDNPLPGATIFTTDGYAADSADVVERFLAATFRGYADADADPDRAVELMKELDRTTNPEQLTQATTKVLELTHSSRTESNGWGWMDDEVWANLIDQLTAGGVLPAAPPAADIYTNDYLPADAASWK